MNSEPTLIANGIAELIRLIIPMLILFGLIHWTGEQVAGLMAVVGFAASFVATVLTRKNVVPVEKANEQIQAGINSPVGTKVAEVIAEVEAKQ